MSELVVTDLRAEVAGRPILTGVNLTVRSGEVHAIMGPNGSGKSTLSHVLMGRPGYTVTGGSVTLDGVDLIGLAPHERAQAGLFLGMQYPTEVPGVSIQSVLRESLVAAGGSGADLDADLRAEAARVGLDPALVGRSLNVDFSGGEKKRNETVQLALLRPKFAILDEIDPTIELPAESVGLPRGRRDRPHHAGDGRRGLLLRPPGLRRSLYRPARHRRRGQTRRRQKTGAYFSHRGRGRDGYRLWPHQARGRRGCRS